MLERSKKASLPRGDLVNKKARLQSSISYFFISTSLITYPKRWYLPLNRSNTPQGNEALLMFDSYWGNYQLGLLHNWPCPRLFQESQPSFVTHDSFSLKQCHYCRPSSPPFNIIDLVACSFACLFRHGIRSQRPGRFHRALAPPPGLDSNNCIVTLLFEIHLSHAPLLISSNFAVEIVPRCKAKLRDGSIHWQSKAPAH